MAQVQERRPASHWAPGGAPPPPDPPGLVQRLVAAVQRHRVALRRAGLTASVLIIGISLTIFVRTLMRIDPLKFGSAFAATSRHQILLSFGFTALSYLALTGYDGLALRHIGVKVPYWLTASASFASYAVSFTLGFPLVTGGAVRYWLYAPGGAHRREHRQPDARRGGHFLARHGAHRRLRLYLHLRRGRRDQPLQLLGEQADRSLGDQPARALYRLGRRAELAPRARARQFPAARTVPDPGTDGARRDRRLLGLGGALCAAAQGRCHRVSDLRHALFVRRDARASPATRRGDWAYSRRPFSRLSAAMSTPCWLRSSCFAACIILCLSSPPWRCSARWRRCAGGARSARPCQRRRTSERSRP